MFKRSKDHVGKHVGKQTNVKLILNLLPTFLYKTNRYSFASGSDQMYITLFVTTLIFALSYLNDLHHLISEETSN